MADPLPWHDLRVFYATKSKTTNLSALVPDVTITVNPVVDAQRRVGEQGLGRQAVGIRPSISHSFMEIDDAGLVAGISPDDDDGVLFVQTGTLGSYGSATPNDDRLVVMECRLAQNAYDGGPVRLSESTIVTSTARWVMRRGGVFGTGVDYSTTPSTSISNRAVPAGSVGYRLSLSGGYVKVAAGSNLGGNGVIVGIVKTPWGP